MTNVKDLYKAQYEEYQSHFSHEPSKYEWVANEVFDLITYDSSLDELFAKDILEVCKAILNRETFDYIRNGSNYVKYILVCQLLHEFHWIEWGTSIRGAWFEDYQPGFKTHPILEEQEWWGPGYTADGEMERHTIESVRFNEENIKALIEFMED